MPEENMNQENTLSNAEMQRMRNVAHNTNNVRLAADVASKIDHPYAKAAGTAVKVADKLTDGKASEKLGKALDTYMKTQGLKGKMMQSALNKMSESGTSSRIAAAANKKNGAPLGSKKGLSNGNNASDSLFNMGETGDQADGGSVSFSFSSKIIKYGVIFGVAALFLLIPICLFTSASNIYIKAIGLGSADAVSFEDAESKINKKQEDTEDLEEGVTEDDLSFDIFIEDTVSFKTKKLENSNLIKIASTKYLRRKYTEADLLNLEDFYPAVTDLSKNYDENMVYDFFFKMYNLYTTYKDTYNVHLDLPLLMSTLMLQSEDMYVIFSSNLGKADRAKTARKKPIKEFDYYYDWAAAKYKITKDNSEHDMELIAQNMVSKQVKEICKDSSGKVIKEAILKDNQIGTQSLFCEEGQTYETEDLGFVIDNKKYKEFLKQFLEKKYFIVGGGFYEGTSLVQTSNSQNTTTTFIKYNLTEDQLKQIASQAYHEQGTPKGAAAEASLMANLFEIKGSKYGEGADGLYNYVRNSGWFANSKNFMDSYDASDEIVEAVRSVLVYGKRTLPGYIDEHDCFSDISSVTVDGKAITKNDRSLYTSHETVIKNVYGSTYKFYSFPDTHSDPFGYISESIREEKGECYYDFDTGEPRNCSSSISGTELSSSFVSLAVNQLNDSSRYGGEKYWSYMGWGARVPWCASFVTWVIDHTSYNNQNLKDIIDKSKIEEPSAVYSHMNFYYNNSNPNINFYYNDNCSKYAGKNGINSTYIPKEGDMIFFDWQQNWSGSMPTFWEDEPDHMGIVQSVQEGYIITIEGNSSDAVNEKKYALNSCSVVGFGSWY